MKAIRDEAELIRWTADPYRFMDLDAQLGLCRGVTVDRAGDARFFPQVIPMAEDHTALEVMLAEFREVLESKRFVPLPGDPVNALVARSCYLEPSIVPWLASVGWHLSDSYRDSLLTSLLQTEDPPTQPQGAQHIALRAGQLVAETRAETIARAISDYVDLSNGAFQISASVIGQLMAKQECLTPQYLSPIAPLLSNPNVHFAFTEVAKTILRLAHNTRSTLTRPDWIILLYEIFVEPHHAIEQDVDPVFFGMYHLAKTVQSSQRTAGWHGLRPVAGVVESRVDTEENVKRFPEESLVETLVEVICSEFLVSPETILLAHASSEILDLTEVARRSALRMVRQPSKGATLLSLTSRYPFLIALIRTSLLSHKPNLSLLPIPTSDPSRPLFAPKPAFLSPIAFDYENARKRLVEERVPTHGTLPVAIALLEIFDKDDEALDVVLSHAILNLNPSITHFYLQHGVPLRPHHLAAADHLGIPRLQAISDYLLQKIVEDATEVEPNAMEVEGAMGKRRVVPCAADICQRRGANETHFRKVRSSKSTTITPASIAAGWNSEKLPNFTLPPYPVPPSLHRRPTSLTMANPVAIYDTFSYTGAPQDIATAVIGPCFAFFFRRRRLRFAFIGVVGISIFATWLASLGVSIIYGLFATSSLGIETSTNVFATSNLMTSIWAFLTAATDCIITLSLCFVVKKEIRSFNAQTDYILSRVIKLTMKTGLVTSLFAVIIAFAGLPYPNGTIKDANLAMAFIFPLPSLYRHRDTYHLSCGHRP
ncbi:hypothetical protein RQP46_011136 [Phenoliferia psychrophenolica]